MQQNPINHLKAERYFRKLLSILLIFNFEFNDVKSIGPCDVTKKSDLENLVSEISKKEKHIDLLVCNAGISGPKAEPESEDAKELKERLMNNESFEEWSDTFNTNVSAVYVSPPRNELN
jgi:NAD(P)-dependent dehydrogenase (short-subunit alcohol dehydrogenase family)